MSWEEEPAPRGAAWSVRVLTGAVAAGLLLVGCGSDEVPHDDGDAAGAAEESASQEPEAEASDEASDEPVPASSEGPAENWPEPEKPDAMSEETEEGALAALEYWWEARQFARDTGEVDVLQEVSMDECETCNSQIDLVNTASEEGGWFVQEADELTNLHVESFSGDEATIRYELVSGAFKVYDEEGTEVHDVDEGGHRDWAAYVEKGRDHWVVREIMRVEEG